MLSADYAYVALPTVNNARTPPNSQFHSPSLILLTSLSLSLSLSLALSLSLENQTTRRILSPLNAAEFYVIFWLRLKVCCTFFSSLFALIYAAQHAAFWLSGLLVCWLLPEGGGWGARHYLTIGSLQLAWLFGHLNHFEWHNLPLIWIIAKPIILALPFSCHCNLMYTRIAPQKVIR